MKHLFAFILALAFGPAFAQADPAFPVMPAQIGGAGSAYKEGVADGIYWAAWTHTNGTRLAMVCASIDYQVIRPDTTSLRTPIATARAFWAANVFANCSTDPFMRPGYLAARAAFGLR